MGEWGNGRMGEWGNARRLRVRALHFHAAGESMFCRRGGAQSGDGRRARRGRTSMCVPLALAALAVLLVFLPGCLTDGSIPVGGGAGAGVLRGVVVHADDPERPFVDAVITLRSPEGLVLQERSDQTGHWQFVNVPDGIQEVTFQGSKPGQYLPVRVHVRTDYASFSSIAVALEPAHMAAPIVAAVRVAPPAATLVVGETLRFVVTIEGGDPRRRVPTWVVEGGIGSITPFGEFEALRQGVGTVRAIAGGVTGAASVIVNPRPPAERP